MSDRWLRLAEVITPQGGCVVAIAEIYVDESGTHAGSPMLGIGGYVFLKSKARRFSREWSAALRRENVPYFHMTDCANGQGIYRQWTKDRRIAHEKELIELVKKNAAFGFAVCMSEKVYEERVSATNRTAYKPYTILLANAISQVGKWKHRTGFKGDLSFFFEAGHEHAPEANKYLTQVLNQEGNNYCGSSFAFTKKTQAAPLQAADLLVWLARNAVMKMVDKKPVRRDYIALCLEKHHIFYHDDVMIDAIISAYEGDYSKMPSTAYHTFVVQLPE